MGPGYGLSNFGFSPHNGLSVQNGWHDDVLELKEEDVWGEEESTGTSDHTYFQRMENDWTHGVSSKSSKSKKSCLSMELQAAAVLEKKKEHVGVAFAMLENGGRKDKNGGWAPGFVSRKVKLPHGAGGNRYGSGWNEHHDGVVNGVGVPQSAPVSVPVWPLNFGAGGSQVETEGSECNDEIEVGDDNNVKDIHDDEEDNDDDSDAEYDCSERRRGRLAPHEIVDMEYARSQKTTLSVTEGAGRTLKGMDLRRVRNAVWSRIGFAD